MTSISRGTWLSPSQSSEAEMSRLFSITLRASGMAGSKRDARAACQHGA
jgi:hypothetical protein